MWVVSYYLEGSKSVKEVIDGMGSQFADRSVSTEEVTVDNRNATKVVVTTEEVEEWYAQSIIIETPKWLYVIGGQNIDEAFRQHSGDPEGVTFEKFFMSFFTEAS